ncbi:MAG: hypothetical protein IPN29_02390 [Saprospiraceae bacterium]|nr:hypothetical protein [Saprospiraceae bacterium]
MAKLAVFHLNGAFESRDVYSDLATQSGGIYRQIKSLDNDVKLGLDELILYKQVYSATYRTNYGQTGTHNISATYQNQNIPVFGLSSYPVDVRPPTVALVGRQSLIVPHKAKQLRENMFMMVKVCLMFCRLIGLIHFRAILKVR